MELAQLVKENWTLTLAQFELNKTFNLMLISQLKIQSIPYDSTKGTFLNVRTFHCPDENWYSDNGPTTLLHLSINIKKSIDAG